MKVNFPPIDLTPKRLDLKAIKAPEKEDLAVEANSQKMA